MRAILIAIHPKWIRKILSGEKTVEVRKLFPKLKPPFICYVYCTKDRHFSICKDGTNILDFDNLKLYTSVGKVVGEFICDSVETYKSVRGMDSDGLHWQTHTITEDQLKATCLSMDEILDYTNGKDLYGWHISEFKLYDKARKLNEFKKPLSSVRCKYFNQKGCEQGCVGFGSTDYNCKDYWDWEEGLTRPPQSWCYVEAERALG